MERKRLSPRIYHKIVNQNHGNQNAVVHEFYSSTTLTCTKNDLGVLDFFEVAATAQNDQKTHLDHQITYESVFYLQKSWFVRHRRG